MSKIDYQALRDDAMEATGGSWVMESGEGWEAICCDDAQGNAGFIIAEFHGENATANRKFVQSANPATVLSLLDEMEAKDSMIAAQQHEIRALLNALDGRPCPKCNDTGMADSGGTQPWGEPIEIECDCRHHDTNTEELVAVSIITKSGE